MIELPQGRWRYLSSGALFVTSFLSLRAVPLVVQMLNDFGVVLPLRVRVAGSASWVPACAAVAVIGVLSALFLKRRPRLSAGLLTLTTVLLLGAAGLTISSLFHVLPLAGDFGLPARR